MLIESPLGKIFELSTGEPIDWLDLTWSECRQRAWRKRTRGGELVRVLLRLGVTLEQGDVLGRGQKTIAVNVLACPVLVARPPDPSAFAAACYELGSLHVPVQLDGDEIITIADGPVEALFDRLGVPWEMRTRRFEPSLAALGLVVISDQFSLSRRPSTAHQTAEITALPSA